MELLATHRCGICLSDPIGIWLVVRLLGPYSPVLKIAAVILLVERRMINFGARLAGRIERSKKVEVARAVSV